MGQAFKTIGCLLLCTLLSIITVSMMEGATEDGHSKIDHSAEDHYLYLFIAFVIYAVAIAIATGVLTKFKIKIGPVEFSRGTQRHKKDK